MNQIGFLLPRSGVYPTITFDILDSFKSALNAMNADGYEIRSAGIGHGANNKEIYTACEQLILNGASIIVGYVNPSTAAILEPLMVASNTLMVALDSGYHLPSPSTLPKNTFTLSLHGALAARIIPLIASQKSGPLKFAFTCTFYDAGYRIPFGLFKGIEECGCQVIFNHTTKLKKAEFNIEPLTSFLAANKDTVIFSATCGDMTKDLFEAAAQSAEYADHPWYCSSFSAEESWLSQVQFPKNKISTIVPWGRHLNNAENATFKAKVAEKDRTPNVFSLLGWEAGLIVAEALKYKSVAQQINTLKTLTLLTPRGEICFDPHTLQAITPLYEGTVTRNEEDGMCVLDIGNKIPMDVVRNNYEKLRAESEILESGNTSWFNSYGCLD